AAVDPEGRPRLGTAVRRRDAAADADCEARSRDGGAVRRPAAAGAELVPRRRWAMGRKRDADQHQSRRPRAAPGRLLRISVRIEGPMMDFSRRLFIRNGVATVSLGFAAPAFLTAIAQAQGLPSRRLV